MPGLFDKFGIHFQYPENWILETEDPAEVNQGVTVVSPGGAFWTVTIHRDGDDPALLSDIALGAMREQYDELDSEPVEELIAGQSLVGYDLNFYCLDLTNTAQIRAFHRKGTSYLLMWQADDREFDRMAVVFRAIMTSMLMDKR